VELTNAAPRFEPIDRSQVVLEPLDVDALIGTGHPARNIWELLGRLDLGRFTVQIRSVEGHAGRNAWEPRLLIALWIYAYSRGISSAREIERQCGYEPAFRWLTGLKIINHHSLSDFRGEHGAALQDLFVQVLGLLTMEKLITLERVTVDGTKVRAAVNKKTFSKAHKIHEHLKVARQHIERLQSEEGEQEKRARQKAAVRRAARERVERLEAALAEVERLQSHKKNERDKPCQASRTDADAQFMRTSDQGVAPAYNVQIVTEAKHKLILDVAVSKQPSDAYHLLPALDRIHERFGSYPKQAIADADYTNREAVTGAITRGVDFYGSWTDTRGEQIPGHGITAEYHPSAFHYEATHNEMVCPEGKRLQFHSTQNRPDGLKIHMYAARREDCGRCPKRPFCTPKNAMEKHGRAVSVRLEPKAIETYHAKMATAEGMAIYGLRAPIAEFPHAWLKDKLRWVRLRCRGLVKAQTEALWSCLTYNLQRYFKLRQLQVA
jgi:transposase